MKAAFNRSVGRPGAPLHYAAHSHHPWPDVTLEAQEQAWSDAARLLDHKWAHIFEYIIPRAQTHVARTLNLPDPTSVCFGPNTHSFVLRILSCLPANRRPKILTTSSEFMSFTRQVARLEEDGLIDVTRIPAQPFDSFEERFSTAASAGGFDLVFLSQVFFDSGYRIADVKRVVDAVRDPDTLVVIDGYHGFMAVPTDFGPVANRAFYLAGGYKYAMAGEGACFLHAPPGYGERPRDTGWYAGFSALEAGGVGVPYGQDGSRFLGATFDATALYRFNAVQEWLARESASVDAMLAHVREIERDLLSACDAQKRRPVSSSSLLVNDESRRGRFLCFQTANAGAITQALAGKDIIVDHRGNRLRVGFGIYHDKADALRLAEAITTLAS